ncbi:hypothetical protein BaRGS_00004993 [Batillaria attramentaria]|uniref:Alpha-galactosidase n=1 Tax=Batillaria attramentaria TaxID=370345 RepID=A0ABD0LW51_9CAEN
MEKIVVLCFAVMLRCCHALDNGLARTPPMGWLSWQRYRCNLDCKNQPTECVSENLYMAMADRMASDGYRDAGYVYINIDDCWPAKERDANGSLVADPDRFPSGMKALADYVHAKGLKLGIYSDMGYKTCGGYPGSKFYIEQDAQTFAAWGIDSLKLDGCNSAIDDFPIGYPIMGAELNKTGRPILYSCSWPAYFTGQKLIPQYKDIAKNCNLWRNYIDIDDSFDTVTKIIQWFAQDQGNFTGVAGPGNWNDPDMDQNVEFWRRQIMPVGSYAIALVNYGTAGGPTRMEVTLSNFGLDSPNGYNVTDAFDGTSVGVLKPEDNFVVYVKPSGVFFAVGIKL